MIIDNKGWARSLHEPIRNNQHKEMCSWSDDLQATVHRFDLNTNTCRCGSMICHKPEYAGGWKRQKCDEPK